LRAKYFFATFMAFVVKSVFPFWLHVAAWGANCDNGSSIRPFGQEASAAPAPEHPVRAGHSAPALIHRHTHIVNRRRAVVLNFAVAVLSLVF
jgi:hypothetical protein